MTRLLYAFNTALFCLALLLGVLAVSGWVMYARTLAREVQACEAAWVLIDTVEDEVNLIRAVPDCAKWRKE